MEATIASEILINSKKSWIHMDFIRKKGFVIFEHRATTSQNWMLGRLGPSLPIRKAMQRLSWPVAWFCELCG